MGFASGDILFFQHQYELEFTEQARIIHPQVIYPYGEEPFSISDNTLNDFAIGANEESISILFSDKPDSIRLISFAKESSFIDEAVTLEENSIANLNFKESIHSLIVDPEQEWAYVLATDGNLFVYDIRYGELQLNEKVLVTGEDVKPTLLKSLTGRYLFIDWR